MLSTYETSSHNQNEQVQYVYHCCLCLIFDQNTLIKLLHCTIIKLLCMHLADNQTKEFQTSEWLKLKAFDVE